MDAHSVSYTIPSNRATSRIYQDLADCRPSSSSCSQARIYKQTTNSTTKMRTPRPSKPPTICIVGAGISGLRCADILIQYGFDVTIFEARDRIGGRMHQTALPSGHIVDLGPNWIHGTEHNSILDLAKETQTETHNWGELLNVFGDDGKLVRNGRALGDVQWDIIVKAFKHSSANTLSIDKSESLGDFFRENVQQEFQGDKDSEQKRKIVMQMSELWGAFVGSPVEKQSLKFFWLEECIEGENLFCAGTYQRILGRIAQPALTNAAVKLGTKLIRIDTSQGKTRVFYAGRDGHAFDEFDEVVITTPLGWLKNNKTAFVPSLPDRLSLAIDAIGYGSLEKVYITFPRAFWLQEGVSLSDQKFTGFTQWMSPTYTPETNPSRWCQECVDLSTLPGTCAHPTLLYYIYGDQSITLSAKLATLHAQKERGKHLIQFFQPYYSLMPNYSADSKECEPVSCLATTWVLDEFAGNGSYSTFRTGLEEGDKDIEIMREGLPDRNLWFAGEHTAPFVALGTVTGAYWSGEAVGKRIADAYQMAGRNEEGSIHGV